MRQSTLLDMAKHFRIEYENLIYGSWMHHGSIEDGRRIEEERHARSEELLRLYDACCADLTPAYVLIFDTWLNTKEADRLLRS
jgi:hypothetical protein